MTAEKLTIEHVIESLRIRQSSVPQPEGCEVANAYRQELIPDLTEALHIIAVLLTEARRANA